MSSLVAYEESDSESEDGSPAQSLGGAAASVLARSCHQAKEQKAVRESNSPAEFSQRGSGVGFESHRSTSTSKNSFEMKVCDDSAAPDKDLLDTASNLSFPDAPVSLHPIQTLPYMPQNACDWTNTAKRHNITRPGVRPYIPKRQRLSSSLEKADPNPAEHVQNKTIQVLSDVSAKVKLYLTQEPSAARTPRRFLMSLGGHQGPVNTVRWCPVPHLSHLLLSASMDQTFKVWNGVESGHCLRVYTCHSGAVRDACWTPCGRRLLTGSFDNMALITDVETGQQIGKSDNEFKLMRVVFHPNSPEIFLCGGYSSVIKAWDSRSGKVVKVYKAAIQQTLDILFLRGGADFITSSDCVSRDSADRTLIAWDYRTTAKVSNQIYHERYTCPSLALHPQEESFVAQTNGNYVAVFSCQRPYKMNKRRQYKGHKVEGYAVQCEFSQDGTILASGSSTGIVHFYDYHNVRILRTLQAHSQPCLCVSQHPVLPATAATCDWGGEIKIWH